MSVRTLERTSWKPSKGKNSAGELAFLAAKSVHGSAQVQTGGAFQHSGETAQRGNRERNERNKTTPEHIHGRSSERTRHCWTDANVGSTEALPKAAASSSTCRRLRQMRPFVQTGPPAHGRSAPALSASVYARIATGPRTTVSRLTLRDTERLNPDYTDEFSKTRPALIGTIRDAGP